MSNQILERVQKDHPSVNFITADAYGRLSAHIERPIYNEVARRWMSKDRIELHRDGNLPMDGREAAACIWGDPPKKVRTSKKSPNALQAVHAQLIALASEVQRLIDDCTDTTKS